MRGAWIVVACTLLGGSAFAQSRGDNLRDLSSDDDGRADRAIAQLVAEGPAAFDDILLEMKGTSDHATRRRALRALIGISPKMKDLDRHAETFLDILQKSVETKTLELVVQILGHGGARTFELAVGILADSEVSYVRKNALRVVASTSARVDNIDSGARAILGALDLKDLENVALIERTLEYAGPATLALLYDRTTDKDEKLAAFAEAQFVRHGAQTLPLLRRELASRNSKARIHALRICARIGSDAGPLKNEVDALLKAKNEEERRRAGLVAIAIGSPSDSAKRYLSAIKGADLKLALECWRHTSVMGYSDVLAKQLIPIAVGAPSAESFHARELLGRLDRGAVPVLVELCLNSKNARARAVGTRALLTLWRHCPPELRAKLQASLADPDDGIRAAAAAGWASCPDASVQERLLTPLLEDKSAAVRNWAAYGLWRNGLPQAVETFALLRAVAGSLDTDGAQLLGKIGVQAIDTVPALRDAATGTDGALAYCAVEALHQIAAAYVPGSPTERGKRVVKLHKSVVPACAKAWAWLAQTQTADGLWRAQQHGGHASCSVGVSALALLAFSAGGHNDRGGPYAMTVRRGLDALAAQRAKTGSMGGVFAEVAAIQNLLATAALLDAQLVGGSEMRRDSASAAVAHILAARRPGDAGAWGYASRLKGCDTFHTTWAVIALDLAQRAGLSVDGGYQESAHDWIDKMTDPEFGQTGYDVPGGSPSRPKGMNDAFPPEKSHSMTAAAILVRTMFGEPPKKSKMIQLGLTLCLERPPVWDTHRGDIDQMYWYFGATALHWIDRFDTTGRLERRSRKQFIEAARVALLESQESNGSWNPVGAWGESGGRVYSTALAVMTLLAEAQYGPGLNPKSRKKKLPKAFENALSALRRARSSDDARVALRAKLALRDLGR